MYHDQQIDLRAERVGDCCRDVLWMEHNDPTGRRQREVRTGEDGGGWAAIRNLQRSGVCH